MLGLINSLSSVAAMIVGAVMSAAVLFSGMTLYDSLIDDPAVARKAREGLVAVAKLATAEAERDAAQKIADHAEARAKALESANEQFRASLELTNQAYQETLNDLEALAAQPAPPDCSVSDSLAGRLRQR